MPVLDLNCPNCGVELNADTLVNLRDYGIRTVQYGPAHWRVQWTDEDAGEWVDTGPPHPTRHEAVVYAVGQIMRGNFTPV